MKELVSIEKLNPCLILSYFSFFLIKKKQKIKTGRIPRTSPCFQVNLSKKTKVFAKISTKNRFHPDTASRPAEAFARLRIIFLEVLKILMTCLIYHI